MSIFIYNSLTREKKPFEPLNPPEVKIYVCGPTVYDEPHIGHARSAYIFDVIRRYLAYKGYKVTFVRNVTDVDDKIIDKAKQEFPGEDLISAVKKVSTKYLDSYHEALDSLGIGNDNIREPKASEYIPKMVKFIQGLIDKGAAYVSGGDVYFDITKAKNYGKLSNQSLDKMEVGARVPPGENKKNPLDFALWKSAKENEPSWESPWGKGRPGWHIECSVMSSDILGDEFDIHGGGIDLIFPHHENEIAQSEGAGKNFARVWIHHGLLTINGQKMAKSLGNFVKIEDVLNKYPVDVLKIFYLQAHYSSPIDFSWDKIEEAKRTYGDINILCEKLLKKYGTVDLSKEISSGMGDMMRFKNKFIEYMDDDFNTQRALSVLFDMVNRCNKLLDSDHELKNFKLRYAMDIIEEIADVLGLELQGLIETSGSSSSSLSSPSSSSSSSSLSSSSSSSVFDDIGSLIAIRNEARKKGDFKEADKIRKELEEKGIILEDVKDGNTTLRMQWEKLAKYIEEELNLHPDNIDLRLNLSIIYGERIGNKRKAIDLCNEILQWDANNISAKFNLAVYTNHLKGSNESFRIFEEAEALIKRQGLENTELYGKLNIFIGHDIRRLRSKEKGRDRYIKAMAILKPLVDKGYITSQFWLKDAEKNLIGVTEEINTEKNNIY